MTAWEILTGNSTAPIGSTAWVHLQNQQGGSGGDVYQVTPTESLDLILSVGGADLLTASGSLQLETTAPTLEIEVQSGEMDLGLSHGEITNS